MFIAYHFSLLEYARVLYLLFLPVFFAIGDSFVVIWNIDITKA